MRVLYRHAQDILPELVQKILRKRGPGATIGGVFRVFHDRFRRLFGENLFKLVAASARYKGFYTSAVARSPS